MSKWKVMFALTAVGALVAGPALAQTTKQSPSSQSPSATQPGSGSTSDTQKPMVSSDTQKPMGSSDTQKPMGSGSTTDKSSSSSDTQNSSGSQMGRMSSGQQDEAVKAAQQALKDKGHDPGPIDGVMGPHTMQALKDFQKAEGLKATGRLDSQTREKLGVASSSSTKQSK